MNRHSAVWAFFSKIDRDSKQVSKCNLCFAELSGHRAGNASKHLRTIHRLAVATNIEEEADGSLTRIDPHSLRKEVEELKLKKASLLKDVVQMLGQRHLLTPPSPKPHKRSNHLDNEQHKATTEMPHDGGENDELTKSNWRHRSNNLKHSNGLLSTNKVEQTKCGQTDSNQSQPTHRLRRTLLEVKLLNTFVHGDWCRHCYVDVITQLYRAANKRSTVSALFGSFLNRLPDAYYEWLGMSSDAVVDAADAQLRPYLEAICFCDLKAVEAGRLSGFILEYGSKRLGGVYLRFDDARKTINVFGPLLPRELLCSPFSIRFVAALLKQQGYHRWFDRIEFLVPRNLIGLFEPLLAALGTSPEDDLPSKLGLQPTACIGYSLTIAYVFNTFA
ncbi:hypothetical protein AAVH_32734 [Aphelenchoides avenae]|nr:hypothetical protein AAVH_32734 [Aphelenchus avenae]